MLGFHPLSTRPISDIGGNAQIVGAGDIASGEAFGAPQLAWLVGGANAWWGAPRNVVNYPIASRVIIGAGAIESAIAIGRPALLWGVAPSLLRRRRQEDELLLILAA